MTPIDFIYDSAYKGCKKAGCSELQSKNAAIKACEEFKKNRFKSVSKLIDEIIKDAKKTIIKKRR